MNARIVEGELAQDAKFTRAGLWTIRSAHQNSQRTGSMAGVLDARGRHHAKRLAEVRRNRHHGKYWPRTRHQPRLAACSEFGRANLQSDVDDFIAGRPELFR